MPGRKSIKIDEDVYDQLSKEKGSSLTWSEFLGRLLNSVADGQVHLNRATLQDFDQSPERLETRASDDGVLGITIEDDEGNSLWETTVSVLDPNQSVVVEPTNGESE